MKPCVSCKKYKYGCYCRAFSDWLFDDSPPVPILDKKLKLNYDKFNPRNGLKKEKDRFYDPNE